MPKIPVMWQPDPSLLLHPNIPKPLHGIAPRTVLGDAWWRKTKKLAYSSTDYHCQACGVYKSDAVLRQWLEAHEVYNIDYQRGKAVYVNTVPLCHCCHNYIHDGRLQALLEQGLITHHKYSVIIKHGDRVLSDAGLSKEPRSVREGRIAKMASRGLVAEWSDWRLVVDDIEYPPQPILRVV